MDRAYRYSTIHTNDPTTSYLGKPGGIQIVTIPKKILQIWESDDFPAKWKSSQDSIKLYHSDWEYTYLSERDSREFVLKNFSQYLSLYDKLDTPVARRNVVRYMWLYVNGGVYVDVNYRLNKSLDELFYSDAEVYLIKNPTLTFHLDNSFLASKPRSRFWLDLLAEIERRILNKEWWVWTKNLEVTQATGSGALNSVSNTTRTPYLILPPNLVNNTGVGGYQNQGDVYLSSLEITTLTGTDVSLGLWFYSNASWLLWLFLILSIGLILYLLWTYIRSPSKERTSGIPACGYPTPVCGYPQMQPIYSPRYF